MATAPVLFAAERYHELDAMISRKFSQPGDVEYAFEKVMSSDGLQETKNLANKYCQDALADIGSWRPSPAKAELEKLVNAVLERTN